MDIRLAGFNVDAEILKLIPSDPAIPVTPETISAAYARISRSNHDVTQLRKRSRKEVARSRASNSKIIFEMGHHSIAEHAVFNFDIMGISRLAMEELERLRLVSYTEKSQRYVKLNGDFTVPEEITDPRLRSRFMETVAALNVFYLKACAAIETMISGTEQTGTSPQSFSEKAKEDARYGLPLATRGQLGMTINARNLEHLLRRTANSSIREVRKAGNHIFNLVRDIAPSLLLFPEPSPFELAMATDFNQAVRNISLPVEDAPGGEVTLMNPPEKGDDHILAAVFTHVHSVSFTVALEFVINLSMERKKELFRVLFREMRFFDTPPREFELPDFTFDTVVSAACYAQLKRHRMATLLPGPYLPSLGCTTPEAFVPSGIHDEFLRMIEKSESMYNELLVHFPSAAPYALTNSHRRRVIVKMNLREMYHFSRLRQDEHAQWDIRHLADRMIQEVRRHTPLGAMLICGKSDYTELYDTVFNKNPIYRT